MIILNLKKGLFQCRALLIELAEGMGVGHMGKTVSVSVTHLQQNKPTGMLRQRGQWFWA